MKLQYKAWLLVVSTLSLLTVASALILQQSITTSFEDLELKQFQVESERARRLLNQQVEGLAATIMDYAYWTDTVEFTLGNRPDYFAENFGPDNMKFLGISKLLVLDALGRPIAGAELTSEPALVPISDTMSQMLRGMAVPVLSDKTSKTVIRTYRRLDGELYLVSIAAVRSQFEPGAAPTGALAAVRRFDAAELVRFSDILMRPVRLSFADLPPSNDLVERDQSALPRAETSAPILDLEGRPVAYLVLEMDRNLYQAGRSLALAGALQVSVGGLVVGALLVLLLNHLVLRRLQRTHKELAQVTREGSAGEALLSVNGEDELTDLAEGINDLLIKTRGDAREQRLAHLHQEALQQQLMHSQKTEAIGRFTSGIAHDFNNSLAAIGGWVRLAKEDLVGDHPSASSLDQALKSIRYASGLMKQLLAFSRQSPPSLERIRLSVLVEEARNLIALDKMGRCTIEALRETKDDWIEADPTQMKQVIVNLLINASDAMDGKGKITLVLGSEEFALNMQNDSINLQNPRPKGRYVTLSIRDEGPGIAPENLDRIFEPFFTTKAVDKGTGLGLSVAQGIMARHSGAISVSSVLGEGASFLLKLPAQEELGLHSRSFEPTLPGGPKRVLFVEDDASVREAWRKLLERRGWLVTSASDGEEGWKYFQASSEPWDAVLTDFAMPKLNGLQLARRIGSTNYPPPIILMSGQIPAETEAEVGVAGFSAVLRKPVDQEILMQVLDDAVTTASKA